MKSLSFKKNKPRFKEKFLIDIEKEKELLDYLKATKLIDVNNPVRINRFSGGVSSKVIQVSLQNDSFVIKQSLSKLRVKDDWFSDIRRIITERKCLEVYNRIVPDYVPRILHYDDQNYLFVMESAPKESMPWKALLLNGNIDYNIGEKAAYALARVHEVTSRDSDIKNEFKDDRFFIELRIEPYLKTIKNRHPKLKQHIQYAINYLLKYKTVLVHGDYSPKNILVADNGILILDFEVAHWGNPIFDLAFLTNHFLLKSIKNKKWANSYLNIMLFLVDTYFKNRPSVNRKEMEQKTILVLALLFLARVDGKSPAEYITKEKDKNTIRKLSYSILQEKIESFQKLIELFKLHLSSQGKIYEKRYN